ncbi:MAG TPA: PIG-L deacetylase family protein [Anaerolineales bacterium]|nr:PIG-L deacetylase family protein [Anaerolineales bacterium]
MTRTILAVLAHPDDESFGIGGTLALYSRRGYDTYLICATGGEEGTMEAEHLNGNKDKAEVRSRELENAAKILGLKGVFLLGYRDSGMPGSEANKHPKAQINHPLDEVAGRVVKYIRGLKPDVVITFDPIGGYKHPDHIHIHQAIGLAFEKADDASFHPEAGILSRDEGRPFKPRALYFQVFPRRILRWTVRLMPLFGKDPTKFGRNQDVNLKELAEVDFPVHVRLDIRPVAGIKHEAGAAHASQGGMQMRRGLMGFVARLVGEREDFMRAYPPVDKRFRRKRDLFDGI